MKALAAWQACSFVHPFTCGPCRDADEDQPVAEHALVPTPDGWVCTTCDYRQYWAHEFMFERIPAHPFGSIR